MTRRLHIGGWVKAEGWEVLDANPAPHVDHVGNASDLSRFADGTFAEIYASHVLEHLDFTGELQNALNEWHRVLAPGGSVSISVPDLDVLARLVLDRKGLSLEDRVGVMRMIFGSHTDKFDYHVVGLNEEFLASLLEFAGYVNIRKVPEFGLFKDTSTMLFKEVQISLNMMAEKRRMTAPDDPSKSDEPGRNQHCPCGSGRKFKHCHGKLG